MKTMVKKIGIATLMAIVMAAALLLAGCLVLPEDDSHGMGTVRVILGDEIQRTILPNTWAVGDFEAFKFEFTTTGGPGNNAVSDTVWKTKGQHNTAIQLVDGTYTLIVIAYMDAGVGSPPFTGGGESAPTLAAAAGAPAANVVIATNNSNTVNVTLHAYEPSTATGSGRFEWNITNNVTGLTAASMQVYQLNGTTTVGTAVDLTTGTGGDGPLTGTGAVTAWAGHKNLTANYYYADFTLTLGTGPSAFTKHFRHALHVYQNMTSRFTYTFTNDDTGAVVAITSYTLTPAITYVHPLDGSPTLTVAGTAATPHGTGTGTVTTTAKLDTTTPTAAIQVTNVMDVRGSSSGIHYDSISWYCEGAEITVHLSNTVTANTTPYNYDTFTATRADAPFNGTPGTYAITVTGLATTTETSTATGTTTGTQKPFTTILLIEVE